MSAKHSTAKDAAGRSSVKRGRKFEDLVMLLWMLGITFLWWLLYGPGMSLITEHLGFMAWLSVWRVHLLQFFTFPSSM